jgi:hypothetical protein
MRKRFWITKRFQRLKSPARNCRPSATCVAGFGSPMDLLMCRFAPMYQVKTSKKRRVPRRYRTRFSFPALAWHNQTHNERGRLRPCESCQGKSKHQRGSLQCGQRIRDPLTISSSCTTLLNFTSHQARRHAVAVADVKPGRKTLSALCAHERRAR